ncbi:MAG TPA: hypothetical protein V6D00_06830 [Pantanalinema sp.]
MFITLNEVVYEVTPSPGGLVFRRLNSDREVFTPWARVLDNSFPVEPGAHTDQILEGNLSVREYLAGEDAAARKKIS